MQIFRQEITNSSGISLYNKAHVSYESKTTQLNVEPFHNTTTHTRQRSLKSMGHWIKWIREHGESVPIYSSMTTISRLTFLFDKTRKIERGIEKKIIIATCHQSRDSRGAPIHHSAEVGRPCSHGVKGQSSTIRKHKKENALNTKTRFVTQRFDNYFTRCRANLNICKS